MQQKKSFHFSRLNKKITRVLADIAQYQYGFIYKGLTVSHVNLSKDGGAAKAYITLLDINQKKNCLDELNADTKTIRQELSQKINARITPTLEFFYDDTLVNAEKITHLIKKANIPLEND